MSARMKFKQKWLEENPGVPLPDDKVIDIIVKQRINDEAEHLRGKIDNPRRLVLTPAADIEPRKVFWAWDDRIPLGEITLTPGRGGIGKSTFHTWLIARITRGELPGAFFGQPRNCGVAATEDSWGQTIVPRMMANGTDLSRVFRVEVNVENMGTASVSLPADLDALEEAIRELDIALLSVDPLLGTVDGKINTHKDSEVRQALTPLRDLASRTQCAIVGNAHFNKSGGTDAASLIMGSAAFHNVPRAVIGFIKDDETGNVVVSQVKNNLGRMDLPSLAYRLDSVDIDTVDGPAPVGQVVMLGESDRSVDDILSGDNKGGSTKVDDAITWLREALSEGPQPSTEIKLTAEAQGLSISTIERAMRTLKADGVLTVQKDTAKQGCPTTWSLSMDLSDAAIMDLILSREAA